MARAVRYRMRICGTGLVLAAIGLLAAGCGGSSGAAATPAPTDQTGFAAYSACMAKNGVTLPQNGAGPGRTPGAGGRPSGRPSGGPAGGRPGGGFGNQPPAGVDQATWTKAQTACASLQPTGGPGGFGGGGNNTALTAYRNCLSDHGATASTGPNALNSADPTVAAAMTACKALLPAGQPNPTAT
jgi:hypothetical protein